VDLISVPNARIDASAEDRRLLRSGFDARHYRRDYPDILLPDNELLDHFLAIGWREGRNPSAAFDTMAYLIANGDVADADINPFVHFVRYGRREGRATVPAFSPALCAFRMFGRPVSDWVERLRAHVDTVFYAANLGPAFHRLGGVDLVAHYAFRGWREGFSPNADFDTRAWLARHPEHDGALVNPLLIKIERAGGCNAPSRQGTRPARDDPAAPATVDDGWADVVRPAFSAPYYLRHHPDAARSGLDALTHYLTRGWRLGYRPTPDFDTSYYLAVNPDVAAAGVEPFWHYLLQGWREGRQPAPPGGHRRRIIEQARPPDLPTPSTSGSLSKADEMAHDALATALAEARNGLVLSFSHDRYTMHVGGTQIVLADEQRNFNQRGWVYLHLAPALPALSLVRAGNQFAVWVTLDGTILGCFGLDDLVSYLQPGSGPIGRAAHRRLLVVHSLLGFDPDAIVRLAAAFGADEAFCWVHDYATLCGGFNLLRNDIEFCHAPPPDSMACRVCVHGEARRRHMDAIARVFAAIRFTMVAPSRAAASIWREASPLPHRAMVVQPHWRIRPIIPSKESRRFRRRSVLKIAFAGSAFPSKGWPAYRDMVDRLAGDPSLRFLHFASSDEDPLPGSTFVKVRVTRDNRFAMIDALRAEAIDIVVMLSPWPETFSFVAHEAIVAGCVVLCLADSGNIAALVRETSRGVLFETEEELRAFIASGEAAALATELPPDRDLFAIDQTGTTSALVSHEDANAASESREHASVPARTAA
jgi:hypothetical protein